MINGQVASGPGPLALIYNSEGYLCTGTVISSNVVLTAAHCVLDPDTGDAFDPATFQVRTGTVRWTDASVGQTSSVDRTFPYPLYDSDSGYGDAALVHLGTPVNSPTIPLATSADIGLLAAGTGAVIEGWGVSVFGTTDPSIDLRAGSQVVQSPAYCSLHAQQLGATFYSSGTFCAIDPSGAYGSCKGDSGGPLVAMRPNNGGIVQIGITSRGASTCTTAQPGFYTRVDAVSAWAKNLVSALAPPPPPAPAPPASTVTVVVQPPPAAATPAAPAPAPTFVPAPVAGPPRRYAGHTASHGYLSFTLAPDERRILTLRIALRLRCQHGWRADIDNTWTAPTNGAWTIPATAPLDLTVFRSSDRRYFRQTASLTVVSPGHGQLTGLLRVSKRARAKKVGLCRANLPIFNLRRIA